MPSRKRSSAASWLFRDDNVLVQDCDSEDTWAYFPLFLKFDKRTSQALLSLRLVTDLVHFDGPQSLSLSIHPNNISTCDLVTPVELPSGIKGHLVRDTAITSNSDVLLLSLSLRSPARVLAPVSDASICPKQPFRSRFSTFYSLCRSKRLRFYFPRSQFEDVQIQRLKDLVELSQLGALQPFEFDIRRLGGSNSLQETDWQILHVPDALLQSAGSGREESHTATSNKRPRTASSPVPDNPPFKKKDIGHNSSRERSEPPSYHPSQATTEADTSDSEANAPKKPARQTAPQPSSSCKQAFLSESEPSPPPYTNPTRLDSKEKRLQRVSAFRQIIRQEIPGIVRQELPGILRQELPGIMRDTLPAILKEAFLHPPVPTAPPALPTPSRAAALPASQDRAPDPSSADGACNLPELVEQRLPALVEQKLPPLVDARLGALVDAKLPAEVDAQIVDLLDDAVDASQVALGEIVDNALLEIKGTRDECVKDIEDAAREGVDDVRRIGEDVRCAGVDVLGDVEESVARLEGRVGEVRSAAVTAGAAAGARRAVSV
ncbi:hypothetical protein MPH_06550 [Macrophomina phaseolina MS6]|uniref:Uncharacterized protein n=1 Tax=Macrophomina phaseolina (strain MS6) TaxID=1126212 RepID=K2RU42_MACPH|nr:hypothetical protein MPH_06550 [Macrophomina phaseolina MS6]